MFEELHDQYLTVFSKIAEYFGCEPQDIAIRKSFSEGKSGDLVLLIAISRARDVPLCGEYVLKVFLTTSKLQEIEHTHAANENAVNGRIIIPKLRCFSVDPAFYLYDMAGDDYMKASAMAKLDTHALRSRLEDLSAQLFQWNQNIVTKKTTIYHVIVECLGEGRLSPESRLTERIRTQITDELTDVFRIDSNYYPNPLYYLITDASPLNCEKGELLSAVYGQIHGDLNTNNVIVQAIPGSMGYRFYLVDFEQYRSCAPLFFDHAYLLLCILMENSASVTMTEWRESIELLFENLSKNEPLTEKSEPSYLFMQAQRNALDTFLAKHPHNRSVLIRQLLAAHVAAGLNFVNKRNSEDRQQKFALIYAAIAMRELLALIGENIVERPNVPELQTAKPENMGLWRIAEHFSPDNRYILLTSGRQEYVTADQLINLAPVCWTGVIECNHLTSNPVRDRAIPVYKRVAGYRVYEVPEIEARMPEAAPAWIHLTIPEEQKNPWLYYSRQLRRTFEEIVHAMLSSRENENLFVIVDSSGIGDDICSAMLQDLVVQAGENTPIHVIGLSGYDPGFQPEDNIVCSTVESGLVDLTECVYLLRGNSFNSEEIRIPGRDGFIRIAPEMVANLQNDMILVHRNIMHNVTDDNGEGFFHGNEATWVDIANERDVPRLAYQNMWKAQIASMLDQVVSGAGIVMRLYHRPGGGGTTLAKRIAWDFCTRYPTLVLHTLSDQTAERLKALYSEAKKPLLVIAEVSDGKISQEGIGTLRRELVSKSIRVMFLLISRFTASEKTQRDENTLYLPDTEGLFMDAEEARQMLGCFTARLKNAEASGEDSDDFSAEERIQQLNLLTYEPNNEDLRQPFFYGLYTYENSFHGVAEYVAHNISGLSGNELLTLNVLSMVTAYSQSINLSFEEVALFLCPDEKQPRRVVNYVMDWMYGNALVVRRDRGMRICHPIIAEEILHKNGMIQFLAKREDGARGTDDLSNLACLFVERLVGYFGKDSRRVNNLFHEIFTHRDVVDEEESKKFSAFLTTMYSREQCVKIMSCVANQIPQNPHYKNHLARLYLYPILQSQTGVFPEPGTALKYARQAIECAKQTGSNVSIHYHVLGKAYTKECVSVLRKSLRQSSLDTALKESRNAYLSACNAFDDCIASDKSGYGLTGKLELITSVLSSIKKATHKSISAALTSYPKSTNEMSNMIAQAGELISSYINRFDIDTLAFRNACVRFYSTTGDLDRLELLINANATTAQERINRNRAISTVLMDQGFSKNKHFSYDNLPEATLRKINQLMTKNMEAISESEADRIRWLETYRRLPEFSLSKAYQVLLDWPHGDDNIFVCYYRYIIAFLIYSTSGDVEGKEVNRHLIQTESQSRTVYGKNVTVSLNYYGMEGGDKSLLIPRISTSDEMNELTKEQRAEQHETQRKERCKLFKGTIESVDDGMINIRFSIDGSRAFIAKTPNIYGVAQESEGQAVSFHLGFSYSGMRAWDVILEMPQDNQE